MGKGFQNFMSKKTFHPGSYQNQKRVQDAEAAAEAKRKHDQETLAQYLKEQELFQQQSLVSRESKDKLSLNFMYSAPPGTSNKEDETGGDDDPDIMLRTSIKWNKEIKQESKLCNNPTGVSNDSDEDEPRIVLKWKRSEPKSKNHRPVQASRADPPQRVKEEKAVARDGGEPSQPNVKRVKQEK